MRADGGKGEAGWIGFRVGLGVGGRGRALGSRRRPQILWIQAVVRLFLLQ